MSEPVILVENLSFTYAGGFQALKDINIRIEENEFVGIIGQNGAGKSTLLKNIIGLLKPTEGRVVIVGNDTRDIPVSKLSIRVGFVLQNPDLQLFADTIREEVAFGPLNMGIKGKELDERVDSALETVGLEDNKKDFPLALSKGERAKIVIASVLAMDPEIIILDEPTCGQDYHGCHQIMAIARNLREAGKTIVVVTHHMSLIAGYAERLIVFRDGGIFMDDKVGNVFSRPDELINTHIKPPHITRMGLMLKDTLDIDETILSESRLGDIVLSRVKKTSPNPN